MSEVAPAHLGGGFRARSQIRTLNLCRVPEVQFMLRAADVVMLYLCDPCTPQACLLALPAALPCCQSMPCHRQAANMRLCLAL
jgi:hypothetical protein